MERKMGIIITVLLVASSLLAGCTNRATVQPNITKQEEAEPSVTVTSEFPVGGTDETEIRVPDEITEIPSDYYNSAEEQGKLEELYYDTYESFSYEDKSQTLTKRAVVYVPYGYSEKEKYDVFYLMHGGWSNETTTLGMPGNESSFKNVLDHAIQNEDIRPLIVVCPTYNNTNENGQDSDSFSLAMQLTRNYHNELVNDLIPAVEGKYSTFAEGTSLDALTAARDHRGFGGFSMGSVTTWRTFEYCMDYFRYYLPMSCGTSLDDEEIWKGAEGYNPSDYFVFMMTGTSDFAYSYDNARAEAAVRSDCFTEIDNDRDGNLAYRIKEGYSHDGRASMEYTYNGMKYFFGRENNAETGGGVTVNADLIYTTDTPISDVINDPAFGDYGRLIFPVDTGYYSGDTLGDLRLTWYSNIQPDKTVEIANYLKAQAELGETIFFDIYSDAEKKADPDKEDTGLFFFKGSPGEKFAICNAGGGFAYVGAMHDSFPHALELSKKGYNAFVLIYRPGAQTACEDLARTIAFIFEHAEELEVDTSDYSLWGGSAGARMAAWLGSYGTESFGENVYPRPAAVIMQYTSLSEVTGMEPPTYICVGTSDGIANYRTMQARIDAIKSNGTDAEIEVFQGLSHGFGLGTGTVAEGWLDNAVAFWERQMNE